MALIDNRPVTARAKRGRGPGRHAAPSRAELDSMAIAAVGGASLDASRSTRYVPASHRGAADAHIALVMAAGTIAEGKSRNSAERREVLGAETLIKAPARGAQPIVGRRDRAARRQPRRLPLRRRTRSGREVRRCAESEAGDRQHVRTSPPRAATTSRSPADTIVAEPGTLTGSIGAFGGKLNLLGLYHKLGLNVETVSRGRHAEMFSPVRGLHARGGGTVPAADGRGLPRRS